MKFFIDTANLNEIREAAEIGVIDGVTTSPSLIAKAGADYISPFLGRLDDIGQNGLELLAEIVEIYSNYDWQTAVLAASIRHPIHVAAAARMGAHVATMPFKVIEQLVKHPLTDKGLEQFLADWRKGKH